MTRPVAGAAAEEQLARFARNLDWNLLRTFLIIVQEGSLTHAASRLGLQQPAVSMALRRLEETLGQMLIDRRPGRFELTPAGQVVLRHAGEIFGTVTRLHDASSLREEEVGGHIRLYSVSSARSAAWDRMLEGFFAAYPRVTVSVSVVSTAEVILAVERKIATLGISDGVVPAHLAKRVFARERFGLFCGRGHPFYGQAEVSAEALRGLPYVSFTRDVLGGEHMDSVTAVRAHSSFGQWVRAASANVEEVQRLIAANVGIGMLPVHLTTDLVASGALWPFLGDSIRPVAETYALWHPSASLSRAEELFISLAAEVAAHDHF